MSTCLPIPLPTWSMPGLAGKVEYAQFLHDGSEIRFTEGQVDHFSLGASRQADLLVLELPTQPGAGD